jgi:hypothetical protein
LIRSATRIEPVATQAVERGFHGRNPALPLVERRFLPWLHADRDVTGAGSFGSLSSANRFTSF